MCMLRNKLRKGHQNFEKYIQHKRPENAQNFIFYYNYAKSDTVEFTVAFLEKCGFEELLHPSPAFH